MGEDVLIYEALVYLEECLADDRISFRTLAAALDPCRAIRDQSCGSGLGNGADLSDRMTALHEESGRNSAIESYSSWKEAKLGRGALWAGS